MRLTYDLRLEAAQGVRKSCGAVLDLEFHLITPDQRQRASQEGVGNCLGREDSPEPLVIHLLAVAWDESSQDQTIFQVQRQVFDKVRAEAKARGIFHPYLYMNYASQFQDVVGSYSEASRKFLKDVSRKYDLEGVFQKLQPGTFKLDGPPALDESSS